MLKLKITKNEEINLFQADAQLTLPTLFVSRLKGDRDDLEYELRRAFEELVGEIVQKSIKDEF